MTIGAETPLSGQSITVQELESSLHSAKEGFFQKSSCGESTRHVQCTIPLSFLMDNGPLSIAPVRRSFAWTMSYGSMAFRLNSSTTR